MFRYYWCLGSITRHIKQLLWDYFCWKDLKRQWKAKWMFRLMVLLLFPIIFFLSVVSMFHNYNLYVHVTRPMLKQRTLGMRLSARKVEQQRLVFIVWHFLISFLIVVFNSSQSGNWIWLDSWSSWRNNAWWEIYWHAKRILPSKLWYILTAIRLQLCACAN